MWNKTLKNVVEVRSSSGSIIGIKISGYDRDLLIINVYLPYCCPDNVDDLIMNKLGEINACNKILMPVLQIILALFFQNFVKAMDLSYLTINYFHRIVSRV